PGGGDRAARPGGHLSPAGSRRVTVHGSKVTRVQKHRAAKVLPGYLGRSDRRAQKGWPRGIKASASRASKVAVRMVSKTVAFACAAPQPSPEKSPGFCILVFEASQEGLGQPLYVCR